MPTNVLTGQKGRIPPTQQQTATIKKEDLQFIKIALPPQDILSRFEKLGVNFIKKPDDGKMKGLAFITDPDGYWIEILQANMIEKASSSSE